MSEHLEMASKKKKQPNRKQPKQISFRVSESEYLNLERSAKVLNISVPAFVKKKAQGARVVAPKINPDDSKEMARQLAALGNNVNQLAKRVNQIEFADKNTQELISADLSRALNGLGEIWRQLT
ncbi:mobilization protein [Lactococcus lactis subsp. lactis]|uniref:plasmid mobilization protein n=1 Tax=Lactococcus lactis TaxID=1358 RepID=UPI00071E064F|nr:plasmid mobilization relaxosome protein MobC [Lactococcus lactis]ARE09817.2 plasmid mobilization relaxosome protein MobC [Lactococcus lactis subsp. lactis]KSU33373.1 mobilization protein [Lactococcus lactis subsp. lactis]URL10121.1 MobC family plasmid mobilization relaxosome protein [Lactococcus lactis subsp. lactis]